MSAPNNAFYVLTQTHNGLPNAVLHTTVFASEFSGKDTDDLSEGSSNLYYTDGRVELHGDTIYVRQDGSIELSANWDAGSFQIRAETFQSDVKTGTKPFTVASTSKVTNLNADAVDGLDVQTSGSGIASLAGNNTWGGTNKYNDDVTIQTTAELKGSKMQHSYSTPQSTVMNSDNTLFIRAGQVTSATKNFTAIRAGSITGISINYDITASISFPTMDLQVSINGSVVWANSLDTSIANDKKNQFTQARAENAFVAGDTIAVSVRITSGLGPALTIEDILCLLEYYYDT